MSAVTILGAAVVRCTILFPLAGVWCADVDLDTETAPTGAVAIVVDGGPTWAGTVVSGAVSHGLWRGRIVGGGGGLRGTLPARAYRSATLADVLHDALAEASEVLSGASGDLSTSAPLWHRAAGPAARTVADVTHAAGYGWRVLGDGTVWLGNETWPDAGEIDLTLVDSDPRRGIYTLAGDTLGIAPGQTLQLQDEAASVFVQTGDVRHVIGAERYTTTVWQAT